jgi:site-specific recombinase XerD
MADVKAILYTDYKRQDGKCAVLVVTVVKRKLVKFNTKILATPDEWDDKHQLIKGKTKEVNDNNLIIRNCKSRINNILVKYRLKNTDLTPGLIRKEYLNPSYDTDFYAFWEAEMKNKKDFIAASTYAQHESVLNKLKEWRPNVNFSEVDKLFLEDFQRQCKKLKNKQNTINKNLKTIKVYINLALEQERIEKSPFKNLQKVKVRTEIEYLKKEELIILLDKYRKNLFPNNKQEGLRQYLFSCFTGIRISDSLALTYNNIVKGTLILKPKKTDKLQKIVKIPLSKPALEMIENNKEGFVFRQTVEQTVNKYLKGILGDCGINKRLRFHSARHTFATMFLHEGGKVEVLQQLLGHEDIRYTMIYVHVSDDDKEKQIRAFDNF